MVPRRVWLLRGLCERKELQKDDVGLSAFLGTSTLSRKGFGAFNFCEGKDTATCLWESPS